jgi:hypothetical protein
MQLKIMFYEDGSVFCCRTLKTDIFVHDPVRKWNLTNRKLAAEPAGVPVCVVSTVEFVLWRSSVAQTIWNQTWQIHIVLKIIKNVFVRFKVFTSASMKFSVFWDVLPCSQVDVGRRFRGAFYLYHQGYFRYSRLRVWSLESFGMYCRVVK